MKLKALALACAFLAGNASASILIDFEDIPIGASVEDFYSGGTASIGNVEGPNYGISFSGGTVVLGQNGSKVIQGPFSVFFTPVADIWRVNFDAAQYAEAGRFSYIYTASRGNSIFADAGFVDTTFNYLSPQRFQLGLSDVTSIEFNVSLADNLVFTSARELNGTVPEPGSIALLGLGAFGLLTARRRKVLNSKEA